MKEEQKMYELARKRINNLKHLINHAVNFSLKFSHQMDSIFRAFKSTTQELDDGLNLWIHDPKFQLNDALQKFNEIKTSIVDKLEKTSSSESAHVYLILFSALVNMQRLKKECELWFTEKENSFDILTKAAINIFTECMKCIRVDISSAVHLRHELKNSVWCSKKLLLKKRYSKDVRISDYRNQMKKQASHLVDTLLALMLRDEEVDLARSTDAFAAPLAPGKSEGVSKIAEKFREAVTALRSLADEWEYNATSATLSTSILHAIARELPSHLSRSLCDISERSEADGAAINGERIPTNLEEAFESLLDSCLVIFRKHRSTTPALTVCYSRESAEVCMSNMQSDDSMVELADALYNLIRVTRADGMFREIDAEKRRLSLERCAWLQSLENEDSLKSLLEDRYKHRWLRFSRMFVGVDCLLFDWERDTIKGMLEGGVDPLKHLDRVIYPLCDLLDRAAPERDVSKRNQVLETCIKHVEKTTSSFDHLRAKDFQLFTMVLYPVIYVADVASDVLLAKKHVDNGDRLYFFMTVLFVFSPLLAETTSKLASKLLSLDKKLKWKDLFISDSLKIFHRSLNSIIYAVKSRTYYDRDLKRFYSELNYLRYKKIFDEGKRPKWINNPNLIQALCYSRMIQNEVYLFDWKMVECLNESAPQLLLQSMIVSQGLFEREFADAVSWIGIFTSLASLSWTMHLSHYNMHFDGLQNNFVAKARILDFLSHFLIICARFLAISFMAALNPRLFLWISSTYLSVLFVYLSFFSSWKKVYRLLLKNRRMLFWPVHRMFVTPYLLRVWRIDNVDDILFHLETLIMAISWPFLYVLMNPKAVWLRWTVPATIISIVLIFLPIFLWANSKVHMPCRHCKGGRWNISLIAEETNLVK